MTAILGISAFYHDSAAALVVDGDIVAAAQEERFSRKKHDERFPQHAIEYCLAEAGITPEDLDYVGFYDKPLLKFERLLETYLAYAPRGFRSFLQAMPLWLQKKLYLPREMKRGLKGAYKKRFVFAEHHESHAASSFFPSPYDEAAILTIDGVGEWATATIGEGRGNRIRITHELRFPHSPGLLYSAFTYYCGFAVNSGEYKLMGLAPYGEPKYVDLILDRLIDLKEDGSFRMDMSYFNYCQGLTMTSQKFHRLFGAPPRQPEARITERDMDIAASIQRVIEEIMLRMSRHAHETTGLDNLCLAGGVALNCVGNGRILREGPFESIWIQPAAGDAGGALGTALFTWYQLLKNPRTADPQDRQHGSLLGPAFEDDAIGRFLATTGAAFDHISDDDELCRHVAQEIDEGKVIGWFQGRMEFGPRALGGRSIIGDARRADMQAVMNVKVKFREGFRPFAPIVLREHAHEYFAIEPNQESPYMLIVAPVLESRRLPLSEETANLQGIDRLKQKRSEVPAITHVDYSARMQTVDAARHGLLRKLMERFYERTGCPVLINTSFNLGWAPIVCTPEEAYRTFMASDIDVLCLGHYVLHKTAQPAAAETGGEENQDAAHGDWLEEVLHSPCAESELIVSGDAAECAETGAGFTREDGVWRLFWPRDARRASRSRTPASLDPVEALWKDYAADESVRSLLESTRRNAYARALDHTIEYNTTILEVGCRNGRLANYLGVSCRRVIGADESAEHLAVAERFRRASGLSRVRFVEMHPSRPPFRPASFDYVLWHHGVRVGEAGKAALRMLLALLKPGGVILIRLDGQAGLDDEGEGLIAALREAGAEVIRGVPSLSSTQRPLDDDALLSPQPIGDLLERRLARLEWRLSSRRNGWPLAIAARASIPPAVREPGRAWATANLTNSGATEVP